MENTVDTNFKSFQLGNYDVTISYTRQPTENDKSNYLEAIGEYKIYYSSTPGYFYVISDNFFGLARIRI